MNQYLQKGLLVFVQGRLVVRSYTDKAQVKRVAIEIVASTVQMLEKGKHPILFLAAVATPTWQSQS